jgi:DNA modification methylase
LGCGWPESELPLSGRRSIPSTLAASVIEEFSDPGDRVVDPFAGYGTTLLVAQRLHREAVGFELSSTDLNVARERLGDPN